MPVDPRILQAIADPTGGKLSDIGQMYYKSKQQAEKEKTAELARQVANAELEGIEVDNLLDSSKILSGVTEQFKIDVAKNPLLIQDPTVYSDYMDEITAGLPEDIANRFKASTPDQLPLISRHANRMVNVLSDVREKKAPKTRKVGEMVGGKSYVVDQEYNTAEDRWIEVGRSEKTSGVTINTGERESVKYAFSELKEADKSATAARKTKENISYAREALKDIETGALTNVRLNLNRIGASFNMPVQEDIPDIASANTAFGNMVTAGLEAFPGQISDGERKFVISRMPSIVQTKEGREQIMTLLDRAADRPLEKRRMMAKYMSENNNMLMPGEGKENFYDKWDKHVEENPLWKGLDAFDVPEQTEYVEIRTLPDGRKMGLKADGSKEIIE